MDPRVPRLLKQTGCRNEVELEVHLRQEIAKAPHAKKKTSATATLSELINQWSQVHTQKDQIQEAHTLSTTYTSDSKVLMDEVNAMLELCDDDEFDADDNNNNDTECKVAPSPSLVMVTSASSRNLLRVSENASATWCDLESTDDLLQKIRLVQSMYSK